MLVVAVAVASILVAVAVATVVVFAAAVTHVVVAVAAARFLVVVVPVAAFFADRLLVEELVLWGLVVVVLVQH